MYQASSNAGVGGGMGVRPPAGALMGHPPASRSWWHSLWSRRGGRFAEIRDLMLVQLGALTDEAARLALAARISEAEHPEVLWALRHELMAALVQVHGELLARRRLTDITFMFAGLLGRHPHAAEGAQAWQAQDERGLVRSAEQLRTDH